MSKIANEKKDIVSVIEHLNSRSDYYSKRGTIWLLCNFGYILIAMGTYLIICAVLKWLVTVDDKTMKFAIHIIALIVIVLLLFFLMNVSLKMTLSSYHLTRVYRQKADILEVINRLDIFNTLDDDKKIEVLKEFIFNFDNGIMQDTSKLYVDVSNLLNIVKSNKE